MKKYLEGLHQLRVFHKRDVLSMTKDDNATKELLRRYKKMGLISQIRRDLYGANDLANKATRATKFEIASQITPSAYLSYHAAMEYHGLANQVFYELYVSSDERFTHFDYEGISYSYCKSGIPLGIVNPPMDSMVKVTDLERTVVDCMDSIGLCGGLEELVMCFSLITYLKEEQLLIYLEAYRKQFLYQKAGFILSYFQKEMKLSDDFFEICRQKTGKSIRYLTDTSDSKIYHKKWKLYAPENILSYLEQGGNEYVWFENQSPD
jgi:predicted transcriptional regulator of viral defense system